MVRRRIPGSKAWIKEDYDLNGACGFDAPILSMCPFEIP